MKNLTPALAFVVLLSLAACNRASYQKVSEAEITTFVGGTTAFNTIKRPEKVEAFTIRDEGGFRADAYPIVAGPVLVPETLATNFSDILTAPATYKTRTDIKNCIPVYGVRLKFSSGTNSVDVLLCFDCDILAFAPDGKIIGTHDFDPGRPRLAKALKLIFKDDKTIQELREQLR